MSCHLGEEGGVLIRGRCWGSPEVRCAAGASQWDAGCLAGPTRGAALKLWDPAEREVVVGASRRWSR